MNIQQHYKAVAVCREALLSCNKVGQPYRGKALSLYNRARARLRHAQNGTTPAKRYEPDFMATVTGIPCGVVVTHVQRPTPAYIDRSRGAGFGDAEPPHEGSADFFLVDRSGYRADWLEGKMEARERDLIERYIERKCIEHMKKTGERDYD